jgi:hypothetical protein
MLTTALSTMTPYLNPSPMMEGDDKAKRRQIVVIDGTAKRHAGVFRAILP